MAVLWTSQITQNPSELPLLTVALNSTIAMAVLTFGGHENRIAGECGNDRELPICRSAGSMSAIGPSLHFARQATRSILEPKRKPFWAGIGRRAPDRSRTL